MADSQSVIRSTQGIQLPLLAPPRPLRPVVPRETSGVVYTRRWVVELLLDLAGYRSESNLVDAVAVEPAAGDGAFLGPMIERLLDSCVRLGRPLEDCRGSLIAWELDDESTRRARALAAEVLTARGVNRTAADDIACQWVRQADYLFEPATAAADFVVGNPPYIRLEEIPEETSAFYRNAYHTMRGRADLYVAFFEAALRQLKPGGVCAFICADRWMRNQYGARLRELVPSDFSVEVVLEMHSANAFQDDVDAYPAITAIRRAKQGPAVIAAAGPDAESAGSRAISEALAAVARGDRFSGMRGLRAALSGAWFHGTDPWPCRTPEQLLLLRRLEDRFVPLETNAKVGIGVATGNDSVFITRDPDLVERSRLLPLAMAGDIAAGAMQWSGNYLVDPWNGEGLVKLSDYPRLRSYFEKNDEALRKRHTALRNAGAWYKTIDRVTHSIANQPKLYVADIKSLLDPVLDCGATYPHHNLYFIQSDQWDLEVLGGLLLSAIAQFFVESYCVRMRGGYFRFQAQYLRRIRLPDPVAVSAAQSEALRAAFRARDRRRATSIALAIYGVGERDLETAREP